MLILNILICFMSATYIDASKFRFDYKYSQEVDGWLKLHIVPASWHHARRRCQSEGGVLASPVSKSMLVAMNAMTDNGTRRCGVYTGIHATFSTGDYYSIEGVPLSKVPARWTEKSSCSQSFKDCLILLPDGTINDVDCSEHFQFICYIKQTEHMANLSTCGTVDPEYKLDSRTGSCYKFHRDGATWSHAFTVCSAEGGHLAIINSDTEALIVQELFRKHPRDTIRSVYLDSALLGFVNWDKFGTWTTIHGHTLEEAGYAKWSPGQPDNAKHPVTREPSQHCGGVFRPGLLDDVWCDVKVAFICEKNPSSLLEGRTKGYSEESEDSSIQIDIRTPELP